MNFEIITWAFDFSRLISKDAAETIRNAETILNIITQNERENREEFIDHFFNLFEMLCDDESTAATDTKNDKQKADEKSDEYRCDIRP